MQFAGAFVAPITETWQGMGLFLDGMSCLDACKYTGVKFDFSGDVGACSLAFGANFSGDESTATDPTRGNCPGSESVCYPPMSTVTPVAAAGAAGAVDDDLGPIQRTQRWQPKCETRCHHTGHGAMAAQRPARWGRLLGELHCRKRRLLLRVSRPAARERFRSLPKSPLGARSGRGSSGA